jgi:amidase
MHKHSAAFVLAAVLASGNAAYPATKRAPQRAPFSVVEASIPEIQAALAEGRVTSRELVRQYLTRIALYEDRLNAVMAVSRDALAQAEALDRERAAGKLRGPLHGIPIALKDNIHTTDMPTTGGALAFDGRCRPTRRRSRATCARRARSSSPRRS